MQTQRETRVCLSSYISSHFIFPCCSPRVQITTVPPALTFLGHSLVVQFSSPQLRCRITRYPAPQKNLHHKNTTMNTTNPPIGPYCFISSSQLILTAALLYFLLSSLSLELISPIRSRLSPRYNRSSIFFVITLVTSCSSEFSLSRFCVARVSEYVAFVRWMKVSNSMKAYGRSDGAVSCACVYVELNSEEMSER